MARNHPGDGQLDLVLRLAADAERQAAERLRAAEARVFEAETRLGSVRNYAREYRQRGTGSEPKAAGRMQDEQRFLLQLEHAIAQQTHMTEQDRRQLESARSQWLAARHQRTAMEALVQERARAARSRRERLEQQRLDDRPRARDAAG